jgi:carboxylesterase type B
MYLSSLPYLLAYFPLLTSATLAKRQSSNAPTVQLLNGSYYGVHSTEYAQDFFLGIPFAQPPIGDLRFRPPQPLNTTFNETRNATAYSPECIGYGSDTWVLGNYVSEDCLTVNVIRPEGVAPGANLPVGVWIYGGGNYNGGNSDPRYNTSFIVQQSVQMRAPMIVVSLNYRLQGWGFLFGKEVVDSGNANLGNRDQRLALHW